ncbi:MAG: DUF4827 domain-containing protein [Prevotella sp.]|nr:DUF4827 domain-containing protein [Prevotella sp.]
MRKLTFLILCIVGMASFVACNDTETYAEQKEKERSAINKFIADSAVKVISETQFFAQDSTTDVSKNEFVLFESSGVYMQIIRKGCGEKLKDGETATVLCRFTERNLKRGADSIQLSNENLTYSSIPEKMSVKNTSGTFSASFEKGSSIMYYTYGSASVPSGWLTPFSFINLGRPVKDGDEIAKVRLIVPHTQGHAYASQSVYPCLYDITYERGR